MDKLLKVLNELRTEVIRAAPELAPVVEDLIQCAEKTKAKQHVSFQAEGVAPAAPHLGPGT